MQSFFASPSVRVSVEEDVIFVTPVIGDIDSPTQDPELKGHVVLNLPSSKAVSGIKVILEALCDVWGGDRHPYETTTVLRKELDLQLNGEKLDAGKHAFGFAFIIPSSADSSQRCTYGRTRYSVRAIVNFDTRLSSTLSSPHEYVWVSPSQTAPGEVPLPADWTTHHFDDRLGPFSMGFSSPHLTVAGLGQIHLKLHDPPTALTVLALTGTIIQQFRIIYKDGTVVEPREARHVLPKVGRRRSDAADDGDDKRSSSESTEPSASTSRGRSAPASPLASPRLSPFSRTPASSRSASPLQRRHPVEPESYSPDPVPLARVAAGQPYDHSRICRIPDADHVRPTTLPGSKAQIVVTHRLSVEVRYQVSDTDEELRLAVEQPVTISGCSALPDNFCLPAYGIEGETLAFDEQTSDPRSRSLHAHCFCNLSTKVLLDRDGDRLRRAADTDSGYMTGTSDRSGRAAAGERSGRAAAKSPAWRPSESQPR